MEKIKVSAKTLDEAITKAQIQLNTTSDNMAYSVVAQGTNGLFGIGAKPWIIEASLKEKKPDFSDIRDITKEIREITAKKPAQAEPAGNAGDARTERKASAPVREERGAQRVKAESRVPKNGADDAGNAFAGTEKRENTAEETGSSAKPFYSRTADDADRRNRAVGTSEDESAAQTGDARGGQASYRGERRGQDGYRGQRGASRYGAGDGRRSRYGAGEDRRGRYGAPESGSRYGRRFGAETEGEPANADAQASVENGVSAAGQAQTEKRESRERVRVVKPVSKEEAEQAQQRAQAFIQSVLAGMGMSVQADVTFDFAENELTMQLSGADMGILIGKRGQTLDSLQYLTSLVVNKNTKDDYIRVKLDTENYRARREATLRSLAKNIAYKVKRTRKTVALEPMNPYERRIIHAALQNDRFVTTRSEGEEPFRHVVVVLKK